MKNQQWEPAVATVCAVQVQWNGLPKLPPAPAMAPPSEPPTSRPPPRHSLTEEPPHPRSDTAPVPSATARRSSMPAGHGALPPMTPKRKPYPSHQRASIRDRNEEQEQEENPPRRPRRRPSSRRWRGERAVEHGRRRRAARSVR